MIRRFLASRSFDPAPQPASAAPPRLSTSATSQGTDWNGVYRDRYNYQRDTVLKEALLAWRLNPLARRLTTITRQYVVDGIEFSLRARRDRQVPCTSFGSIRSTASASI